MRTPATPPEATDSDTKPGAPKGNTNAMRHGLQSGLMPEGCDYIVKQLSTFRKALDGLVFERRGSIGVYETALIQTAIEWYSHCLKARRWLRVAFNDLNNTDRLYFSREAARALSERDKVLKQLGLDDRGDDPGTIYTFPELPDEPDADPRPLTCNTFIAQSGLWRKKVKINSKVHFQNRGRSRGAALLTASTFPLSI